jgi:hypothetical protein
MGTAKRETHSIYLERASSYEYKVSPEGYAAILEILRTKAVCAQCGDYYSPHNPQIAGLLCLSCFLSLPLLLFKQEYPFTVSGAT